MTVEGRRELRRLEGQSVHIALLGGSRLDDVSLVSARASTVWVFTNGQDVFVPAARRSGPNGRAQSRAG